MSALVKEIEQRWACMFSALAAGEDVAPALRLRAEGMMEAAVLLEIVEAKSLTRMMAEAYEGAFECTLEEDLGTHWQGFFPFPQIPAMARRAPVYPSTKD